MGKNFGKWDKFYEGLEEVGHYIDTPSYEAGAKWLRECKEIEDWGCGKGWFGYIARKNFNLNVTSIDGSVSPFADKVLDLEDYTTSVEGIFMRSVAEHNYEWEKILNNLASSFTKRAFVEFYTPMNTETDEGIVLMKSPGYDDVPEISIPTSVWHKILDDNKIEYTYKTVDAALAYGEETYYFLAK